MILLADPTGPATRLVAARLAYLQHPVGVLIREGQDGAPFKKLGIHVIPVEDSVRAIYKALHGVQRMLLEAQPLRGQARWHRHLIDAAKQADVRHVVRMSPFGGAIDSRSPYLRRQAEIDAQLAASGVRYTLLHPQLYMQDLLAFAGRARTERRIVAALGPAAPAWIDLRDAAEAVAAVLTRAALPHETYVLAGPHEATLDTIADTIGHLTGIPLQHTDMSPDALREFLEAELRMSPEAIGAHVGLMGAYRRIGDVPPNDVLSRLTGLPPRTLQGFLMEHAHRFAPDGIGHAWVLPDNEVAAKSASW